MSSPMSLLSLLQQRTRVSCDTLDPSITELSAFWDATSNQAIANGILKRPENKTLILDAVSMARSASNQFPEVAFEELAVEFGMVLLAVQMTSRIENCIHIQVNPFNAYSIPRLSTNALRLRSLLRIVDASFDLSRVCIKLPSTWEGLQACRLLEGQGVKTLATTLFTFEQAALAGDAGCHYVAPYVHDLQAQIDSEFRDSSPNTSLAPQIQQFYRQNSIRTQVVPASLTSIEECMSLAGVDSITIPPPLLQELAKTMAEGEKNSSSARLGSLFEQQQPEPPPSSAFTDADIDIAEREYAFRLAFTRSKGGLNEAKQGKAINIFCDAQLELEALVRQVSS